MIEFSAEYSAYTRRFSLFCRQTLYGGCAVARPVIFDEVTTENEGNIVEPMLLMDEGSNGAQNLIDALWQAGVRPSGKWDIDPVLEAKNENLEDLRRIIWAPGPQTHGRAIT